MRIPLSDRITYKDLLIKWKDVPPGTSTQANPVSRKAGGISCFIDVQLITYPPVYKKNVQM